MLVSAKWLAEFVDLKDVKSAELAKKLTLGTCEVDKISKVNPLWSACWVVQVSSVEKHPNADTLSVVRFKHGKEEIELVCGANNLFVGMKAVWAPVGTQMAADFVLSAKKIRGVLSQGMLCSARELGLGEDHDGIVVLQDDALCGSSCATYFGLNDECLLDIDNKSLTHRPDLWGIYGMARECAALFKKPLSPRFNEKWQQQIRQKIAASREKSPLTLVTEGESALISYAGLSVSNIQVQPSPPWLQGRLLGAGLLPINNLVDISNYVMLELGQPNHIFDRDKLKGDTLRIYQLDKNDNFTTLDKKERLLQNGDTVIADEQGVQIIAGIMGGLQSSVEQETQRIFIEVACWKATPVRRTSVRLGLRSDSSLRYEKALDPYQLEKALLRITELILELCPQAQIEGNIEWAQPLPAYQSPLIKLSVAHVQRILGCQLGASEIKNMLESIGFVLEQQGKDLTVQVPSFRATGDIENATDLIEEIGRLYGYASIAAQAPQVRLKHIQQPARRSQEWSMRNFLAQQGRMQEYYSYPLVGSELLKNCAWSLENEELRLLNPLSPQLDRMRPSLVPSALESVAHNLALQPFARYRAFEIGRSYLQRGVQEEERRQLLLLAYDEQNSPFLELRQLFEELLASLFYTVKLKEWQQDSDFLPRQWSGLHTRERLQLEDQETKQQGFLISVHPRLLNSLRINGNLSLAVLDYTELSEKKWLNRVVFEPPSVYPVSLFDCSVKVGKQVAIGSLFTALKKLQHPFLRDFRILRTYALDEKYNSVTLRSTFQAAESTLSPKQIEELKDLVVETLDKAGFPLKIETQRSVNSIK